MRLLYLPLKIFSNVDLHLLEFDPLRATSYRKVVINIKNKDEKCFLWSVIAGLYKDSNARHPERVSHYLEYEKEFNLRGISFPIHSFFFYKKPLYKKPAFNSLKI